MKVTVQADHTDEVIAEMSESVKRALEAVGLQAEGDVKMLVPVDTGLLRNSITHAVQGGPTAINSYESNDTHAETRATKRAGTAGKRVQPKTRGNYDGNVSDGSGQAKVFVGSNVEYAPYVELGTSKTKAQPYLKPAFQKNGAKYIQMLRDFLEGKQ